MDLLGGHKTLRCRVFPKGLLHFRDSFPKRLSLFFCSSPFGNTLQRIRGLEQHGHAAGGATNSPVGCWLACGSQSVGMSTKTNAVLMLCIGGFFYLVGYPSGTRTAHHYFLLKKHVQNTSGRNGSCVLCTCFLLFGIHPNGQRLICCRICAISALE